MNFKSIIFVFVTMIDCQAQSVIDLTTLTFTEKASELLEGKGNLYKDKDYMSTLYCIYTYDVQYFKYGSLHLEKGGERGINDVVASKVYFLIHDTLNGNIEGVIINIQRSKESTACLDELKKKMGIPKILKPIPKPEKDGSQLGTAVYLWKNATQKISILMELSYGEKNHKPSVDATVYIINNSAKVLEEGNNSTVIDRIIKSYTP